MGAVHAVRPRFDLSTFSNPPEAPVLTKVQPTPLPRREIHREWASVLGRAALAAVWAAQSPGVRERFLSPQASSQLQRTWFRTADGWELPLWRRSPKPGADGAPVLLSVGPGLRPGCLDLRPDRSLVEALHSAGFDVYLLSHRGDPEARPPAHPRAFDFDDLVELDLQAAIDAISGRTRASSLLFVGHGLGGLLFVAHLARFGSAQLAGGATLCAPVVFSSPKSRARELHRIAQLLPPRWAIPHRSIQRWLLATGRDATLHKQAQQTEGPLLRRLALDQTADLSAGLVQQIARWHTAGHLCDRDDRFDDLAALQGKTFPLLTIAADDDAICPPSATAPISQALSGSQAHVLKGGWGHLDPIIGTAAASKVFPRIIDWLNPLRRRCWDRDM